MKLHFGINLFFHGSNTPCHHKHHNLWPIFTQKFNISKKCHWPLYDSPFLIHFHQASKSSDHTPCAVMCTIPYPMGQSLCWIKSNMKLACCLAFTFVITEFLVDKPCRLQNLYSCMHCIKILMITSKLAGNSCLCSSWSCMK